MRARLVFGKTNKRGRIGQIGYDRSRIQKGAGGSGNLRSWGIVNIVPRWNDFDVYFSKSYPAWLCADHIELAHE